MPHVRTPLFFALMLAAPAAVAAPAVPTIGARTAPAPSAQASIAETEAADTAAEAALAAEMTRALAAEAQAADAMPPAAVDGVTSQVDAPASTKAKNVDAAAEKADAQEQGTAAASSGGTSAQAQPEPLVAPSTVRASLAPRYKADLGLDLGADTFLFKGGQTGFEAELSPRLGYMFNRTVDAGFYAAAGYGGPIPEWSQLTMFGAGLYAGLTLPLTRFINLQPWAGVMYHYAFVEGYTGSYPDPDGDGVLFPEQSVRVDVHTDVALSVSAHNALSLGMFAKTRLAPLSGSGPGTAAQVAYGLRFAATSHF